MSSERLTDMAIIMGQKEREMSAQGAPPLDAEGVALAEGKRYTFDMPINAAKSDPLR